jgi:hypothetical protein
MKLSVKQAKAVLPREVRMTYGWRDVLETALSFEDGVQEIDCVDDSNSKSEFIAVYKLVRVQKT